MPVRSPNPKKKFCQDKKCQATIRKERALARHILGENRLMPTRSPPSPTPKKGLEVPVRVIVPRIIPTRIHHKSGQFAIIMFPILVMLQTSGTHQKFLAMDLYPQPGWPPQASHSVVALCQLSFSFAFL